MKQLGALLTGTAFKKQNRRWEYFSLFYPIAFYFLYEVCFYAQLL